MPREQNPYAAPESTQKSAGDTHGQFIRGSKKGPALYIVSFALLVPLTIGLTLHPQSLSPGNIGFFSPVAGCLIGAVVYRLRSKNWPKDPSVIGRMFIYSIIAITLPTAIMFFLTGGGRAQGAGMVAICLTVGISVAAGIILSGTRRHGSYANQTKSENGG